jgi:hypothetical protein
MVLRHTPTRQGELVEKGELLWYSFHTPEGKASTITEQNRNNMNLSKVR